MLRKLTIALAAAVSLSAALAPSAASAKGGFGGGHHHFGHHGGFGGFGGFGIAGAIAAGVGAADMEETTVVDESCFVRQRVVTPNGYRMRTINVCAED
jgi:hypothetical protein